MKQSKFYASCALVGLVMVGASPLVWAQSMSASQHIASIYLTSAEPVILQAEQKLHTKMEKETNPQKKAYLAKILENGLLTPEDKQFIIQRLAAHFDRYQNPAEAAQTLAFLQSPAGQHFIQMQLHLKQAMKPITKELIQNKAARLKAMSGDNTMTSPQFNTAR